MSDKPRVLTVCTAGKDRSVALASALSDEYETRARGISAYHTGPGRPGTHLSLRDLFWADYVICSDTVHEVYVSGKIDTYREMAGDLVNLHFRAKVCNARLWIPELHGGDTCPPNRMSADHVRRWLRKQEANKVVL
jgi:hypothetical protein